MGRARSEKLDATFAALADPTRRSILTRLGQGTATVGELANPFDMSLPAISKHLRVLENAGLIRREKSGRNYNCTLRAEPMKEAAEWIGNYRAFWDRSLRALDRYTKSNESEAKPAKKSRPRKPGK
jgi:DNA-binding transcriptional ArsR family regulator